MPTKTIDRTFEGRHRRRWRNWNTYDATEPPIHSDSRTYYVPAFTVKTGVENPMWKKQIAEGRNATTPYSVLDLRYRATYGTLRTKFLLDPSKPEKVSFQEVTQIPPIESSNVNSETVGAVDNLALIGILKKIQNITTQFHGGVFMGELGEAIGLVVSAATGVKKGIQNYLDDVSSSWQRQRAVERMKKRRKRRDSEYERWLGGKWLEYSFGWLPLLGDIDDGMRALATLLHRKEPRIEVVQFMARDSSLDMDVTLPTNGDESYLCGYNERKVVTSQVLVRYKVGVRVLSGGVKPALDLFGVNWREFVPTAWELVPWSFLADYFSNIGDVLSTMFVDLDEVAWSLKTVVTQCDTFKYGVASAEVSRQHCNQLGCTFVTVEGTPGTAGGLVRSVNRSIPTFSTPRISISLPGNGLGTKLGNMTGIAASHRRATP